MSGARKIYRLSYDARPPLHNDERRRHWSQRAAATREWKDAFYFLAKAKRIPKLARVKICVLQTVKTGTLPDVGACAPAAKAAIDGIVLAGVLDDDSPQYLEKLCFHAPIRGEKNSLEIQIKEI